MVSIFMLHETVNLFDLAVNRRLYIAVFAATVMVYSLHSLGTTPNYGEERSSKHNRLLRFFNLGFILVSTFYLAILLITDESTIIYFIPASLLTLFYLIPKSRYFSFIKIKLYSKTAILSITWLYVTCLMPMLIVGVRLTTNVFAYLLTQYSIIYFICLLFDKRDASIERQYHLFFNPILHLRKSIITINLIFLTIGFLVIGNPFILKFYLLKLLILSFLNLTLIKSLTTRSTYWYYFVLDGIMGFPAYWMLEWYLG